VYVIKKETNVCLANDEYSTECKRRISLRPGTLLSPQKGLVYVTHFGAYVYIENSLKDIEIGSLALLIKGPAVIYRGAERAGEYALLLEDFIHESDGCEFRSGSIYSIIGSDGHGSIVKSNNTGCNNKELKIDREKFIRINNSYPGHVLLYDEKDQKIEMFPYKRPVDIFVDCDDERSVSRINKIAYEMERKGAFKFTIPIVEQVVDLSNDIKARTIKSDVVETRIQKLFPAGTTRRITVLERNGEVVSIDESRTCRPKEGDGPSQKILGNFSDWRIGKSGLIPFDTTFSPEFLSLLRERSGHFNVSCRHDFNHVVDAWTSKLGSRSAAYLVAIETSMQDIARSKTQCIVDSMTVEMKNCTGWLSEEKIIRQLDDPEIYRIDERGAFLRTSTDSGSGIIACPIGRPIRGMYDIAVEEITINWGKDNKGENSQAFEFYIVPSVKGRYLTEGNKLFFTSPKAKTKEETNWKRNPFLLNRVSIMNEFEESDHYIVFRVRDPWINYHVDLRVKGIKLIPVP